MCDVLRASVALLCTWPACGMPVGSPHFLALHSLPPPPLCFTVLQSLSLLPSVWCISFSFVCAHPYVYVLCVFLLFACAHPYVYVFACCNCVRLRCELASDAARTHEGGYGLEALSVDVLGPEYRKISIKVCPPHPHTRTRPHTHTHTHTHPHTHTHYHPHPHPHLCLLLLLLLLCVRACILCSRDFAMYAIGTYE